MSNVSPEHYQAVLEVRYGIHYNAANERLFRRLKFAFEFVTLFAATAAGGAFLTQDPKLAAQSALGLAALSVLAHLVAPGELAARFNEGYRRFTALDRRAAAMTAGEIRDAIGELRADLPWGISALGPVAYNRTMRANGRDDAADRLTTWQRLVALMA